LFYRLHFDFCFPQRIRIVSFRKANKSSKFSELLPERTAEMLPLRSVQSAVPDPMVAAAKSNDASPPGGERCRLQRSFDCFEARIAKNTLATTRSPSLEGESGQFSRQATFQLMRMNVAHRMQ